MTRDSMIMEFGRQPLQDRIDGFFLDRGLGMNPYSLRRERLSEILALEALSDGDLALIGLDRDGILPFVFDDLLAR